MKSLVLIHGRSQQEKNSIALEGEWLAAWQLGLSRSELSMPLAEPDVRFPYYGDTLIDMVKGKPPHEVADVVIRGVEEGGDEGSFFEDVLREILDGLDIDNELVEQELAADVVQRGALNWEWVQAGLRVIDRFVPFGSSAPVALLTRDVYRYLTNDAIKLRLHRGIREALQPGVPTVVVAHSLGTVVAYDLLRTEGEARGWDVPLFVTLGSPLAIKTIRRRLEPIGHPKCVGTWRNAMDERDVVALYPLNHKRFDIEPPIQNKTDVRNFTDNRHGIAGYLDDIEVARWIHDALI